MIGHHRARVPDTTRGPSASAPPSRGPQRWPNPPQPAGRTTHDARPAGQVAGGRGQCVYHHAGGCVVDAPPFRSGLDTVVDDGVVVDVEAATDAAMSSPTAMGTFRHDDSAV